MGRAEPASPPVPDGDVKWRDLREWLNLVDGLGELRHIRNATSEADIGAITAMLEQHEGSPAALFDEIPGFEPGYRVLSNAMGTRARQAVTLGLDPATATHQRLLAFWRELMRGFTPIEPEVVDQGAVLENVYRD